MSNSIPVFTTFQAAESAIRHSLNEHPSVIITEETKRPDLAETCDAFAAIPIIGSLFAIARIAIGAIAAVYYNYSDESSMSLQARDECIRGLWELIPFMGCSLLIDHEKMTRQGILRPGAAGKYAYKHNDQLYYSSDSLKGKHVQWIKEASIIYDVRTTSSNPDYPDTEYNYRYFIKQQGRIVFKNANSDPLYEIHGPWVTHRQTRELQN